LEFAVAVEFVNEFGGDLHLAAVEAEFATPHPIPIASQARHKLDSPNQEIASRNVFPDRGREGVIGRWCIVKFQGFFLCALCVLCG
jgi:hypothetical protein